MIVQTVKRLTVFEHAAAESTYAPCESDRFFLSINVGKKIYGRDPPKWIKNRLDRKSSIVMSRCKTFVNTPKILCLMPLTDVT